MIKNKQLIQNLVMEICGKMESILDLSHENESIKIETLYASLKMMKIQEILKND